MKQGIASFRLPTVGSVGVAGHKLATAMLACHQVAQVIDANLKRPTTDRTRLYEMSDFLDHDVLPSGTGNRAAPRQYRV